MLRVTVDIYSGRPNPSWLIQDEASARKIMREVMDMRRGMAAAAAEVPDRLGFRGLILEPLGDDLPVGVAAEAGLRIPAGLAMESAGRDWIERLMDTMAQPEHGVGMPEEVSVPGGSLEGLREFLFEQVVTGARETVQEQLEEAAVAELRAATCYYERGAFNPGFWNNDPTIRTTNNCYNYASNKRTNTFAQPGRACGSMYTALTCGEVSRASLCDGLHRRYDCFPDSERPRYLIALVIWPGNDFHWYRLHREGFWGHKPGQTNARNVDNSGRIITNPVTADRGPYTQFCGYFYTARSQRIR